MRNSSRSMLRALFFPISVAAALAFCSCGGGGGDNGNAATTLSGTAAIGSPLCDAVVDVKDRGGRSATTRTSAVDGTFVVNVAGMEPPFLLRVDDGVHPPLFGAAAAAGTANVHPLSNLVVDLYYRTFGLDVPATFDGLDDSTPMASKRVLGSLEDLVTKAVGSYLVAYGVDPTTFHPMSSPFHADGTGFDDLLESCARSDDATGPHLEIDDHSGATECTQETQFDVDEVSGCVRATTTVDATDGTHRECVDSIVVPRRGEEAAYEAAVEGALTTLDRLVGTANARGAALTGADIADYFDPLYLEGGRSAASEADRLARGIAGTTVENLGVTRVFAFRDLVQDEVELRVAIEFRSGGTSQRIELPDNDPVRGMVYRAQGDGRFRAFGNQQLATTLVQAAIGAVYDSATPAFPEPAAKPELRVWAGAPPGLVAGVDVVGLFPPDPATDKLVSLVEQPFSDEDSFVLASLDVPWFPAAGTPYEFRVTPAGGALVTYARPMAACTDELLSLSSYDGVPYIDCVSDASYHHLAFVHPGTPLEVRWRLPRTFAASMITVSAIADDGGFSHEESSTKLEPGSTNATLTFPPVLDGGGTIAFARIEITFLGVNGEIAFVRDSFHP